MRVVRTQKFTAMLEKLPKSVQSVYREQEERLSDNPRDTRLHLKKLRDMDDIYSFRITRSYRALFIWEDNTACLFAVGDRKDIYR